MANEVLTVRTAILAEILTGIQLCSHTWKQSEAAGRLMMITQLLTVVQLSDEHRTWLTDVLEKCARKLMAKGLPIVRRSVALLRGDTDTSAVGTAEDVLTESSRVVSFFRKQHISGKEARVVLPCNAPPLWGEGRR